MVDITLSRGTKIWIKGIHGTVAGNQKWSETHVYGSARRGVSSSSVERGEFWVIAESGRETEITLDVPVRAGQEVTVLWGGVEGQDTGPYLMVRNEAAGTTQMVMSISGRGYGNPLFAAYASRELRMHNWFEIPSLILGICGVPYFLITFIGNLMQHGTRGPWLSELLWGFMIFFLIYKFYKLERSFPRLQQELKSEISAICTKLLDDPAFIKSIS